MLSAKQTLSGLWNRKLMVAIPAWELPHSEPLVILSPFLKSRRRGIVKRINDVLGRIRASAISCCAGVHMLERILNATFMNPGALPFSERWHGQVCKWYGHLRTPGQTISFLPLDFIKQNPNLSWEKSNHLSNDKCFSFKFLLARNDV